MPRKRLKVNLGLPSRWRFTHGAFYYQVPPGMERMWDNKKLFRLGTSLNDAYQLWAQKIGELAKAKTIGELLDRYVIEVVPIKAPASQTSNLTQLKQLRTVFANLHLEAITPRDVYEYVDTRSQKMWNPETKRQNGGRIAALREIELLSHAFTKAVEWGYIDRHPFKNEVRFENGKGRDRYVEDWELIEALSLSSPRKRGSVLMIQAYIRLKMLTGLSQGDLLRLQIDHLKEDGIHNQRHKTKNSSGKRTIYQWTPELTQAIEIVKESRTNKDSSFLFCNRDGEGYMNELTGKAPGWKSMWQRFMERVIEETKVTEPFTEHDLRAKVGSDAESLDHARALLAHADSRTTNKFYRRKAEVVKPLKPK